MVSQRRRFVCNQYSYLVFQLLCNGATWMAGTRPAMTETVVLKLSASSAAL